MRNKRQTIKRNKICGFNRGVLIFGIVVLGFFAVSARCPGRRERESKRIRQRRGLFPPGSGRRFGRRPFRRPLTMLEPRTDTRMERPFSFRPEPTSLNRTIVLGKDPAHYGTRLSGYGAALLGTTTLDQQPLYYERRKKALTEKKDDFSLQALPGRTRSRWQDECWRSQFWRLWNPASQEGASYVIEGLTFTRESKKLVGVGIKIPAETVPKNVTFRDIKVHRQNVGVHINHCYQIRFESCSQSEATRSVSGDATTATA